MEVQAALVCNSAVVRNGLLSVLDGGVDHWASDEYRAPLAVDFAAVVEAGDPDSSRQHDVCVDITHESLSRIGGATGQFEVHGLPPGETIKLPVAFQLSAVTVPEHRDCDVALRIDGELPIALAVRAMAV
jgi:hypothetical protein